MPPPLNDDLGSCSTAPSSGASYVDSLPGLGEIPASMPTTYVRLTSDRGLSPTVQDKMIARLHDPRVEAIEAGHLPMLGHPDQIAGLLNPLLDGARDRG